MSDVPSNLIPTRITQLPVAPVADENSLMMIVYQGNNYQIRVGDLLSVAGVPTTRQVIAGTGLTGGGQLSSNVTLSIANGGVGSVQLAASGVTAGTYGSATEIPVFTVDAKGRVMSATTLPISVAGYVPTTRQVIAGDGLTGGGALNANVTLNANLSSSTPLSLNNSGSAGSSLQISRSDHRHPAIDLSSDAQVDNILGLSNGGTARSLVMNPGAVIWSGADGLYVGPAGAVGQVLVSGGTGAPNWGSAVILSPQSANSFFAGPTSGSNQDPTFRAMVNADLPNSGVSASSYGSGTQIPVLAINAKGVVTSASLTNVTPAWAYITGTPTTIAGYGITDGVTLSGSQTLTNKTISGSSNTITSIGNSSLVNSSITVNGSAIALGGSATISASTTSPLTIGTGLSGTSFNGGSPVTIAIDSTVVTLTGTQTLTGKTISGANNTLLSIPNSALTNSSFTIGSTVISLGGTSTTLAGVVSLTLTQDPSTDLQAATKQYVDSKASTGLNYHDPVQAATTQSLAAQTGGTVTYNNGSSGVGATLTLSVPLTTLDGYSLSNTNRILVKDETNQAYNGIYTWATGGTVLTRATDADTYGSNTNQLSQNDYFFVQNGTINKGSAYVVTTVGTIVFGTTAITFAEFSNSQVYTAGTGLTLTGTSFSISNTGVANATYGTASSVPTIAVNAQGQITSASNTSIAINGNQITSGIVGSAYISGSYTGITGVGTLTAGTWNATTIGVGYGGTGLAAYSVGDLLYASGSTALSKLSLGAANYVLTAGASAPQYVAQSTLSVGSATTATNLAGGAASQLPYQSASGTTTFLANGTAGQVLKSNGSSAPSWSGIDGGTF